MADGFLSDKICAGCQGRCCKTMGCSLEPEDMIKALADKAATRENVESLLQNGQFAIDSFQTGGRAFYFLRMKHKCFTFIGVDAMGECAALTDEGCSLAFEDRPKGGRMLEGRVDGGCIQHYTQEMMIADWKPYQEILGAIWTDWYDRFEKDGVFDRCEEDYMQYQMRKRAKGDFDERS